MIYLGAFITSFFIVKVLLKKTNRKQLIFWYLGTGMTYFFLLVLYDLETSGLGEFIPLSLRKFGELIIVMGAFLMIWPIIIFMTFGGIFLFSISYSGLNGMEEIVFFGVLLFTPQLGSFLITGIISEKGFFQRKNDTHDYEEQNDGEENSSLQ